MKTSRPPTSAVYETCSNVITEREREKKGIQESFPFSQERRRKTETERDFIWVCLKSQASIWPQQLHWTELEEKRVEKSMRKKGF